MGAEYSRFRQAVARAAKASQRPAWDEAHHGLHASHVRVLDEHEGRLQALEKLNPDAKDGKPGKPADGGA
jgi:uncharacterized membrane-anchored protein